MRAPIIKDFHWNCWHREIAIVLVPNSSDSALVSLYRLWISHGSYRHYTGSCTADCKILRWTGRPKHLLARILQRLYAGRTERPNQRSHGCNAVSGLLYRKCVSQAGLSSPLPQHHRNFPKRFVPRRFNEKGTGPVAFCAHRLWNWSVFHQTAGKGFRARGLRNHPRVCTQVTETF